MKRPSTATPAVLKRPRQVQLTLSLMSPPVVSFWREDASHGFLCNFYSEKQFPGFRLVIDGKQWASTEHYYQAQKVPHL